MGTPAHRCVDLAQLKPPEFLGPEDWDASNKWLKAVVDRAQHDSQKLFAYFRLERKEDLTVQIMQAKDILMAGLFPGLRRHGSGMALAVGESRRSTDEASTIATNQLDASLQTTYLYYSVLYYILHQLFPMRVEVLGRSTKTTVAPEDVPRATKLLKIPVFHTSLMTVAAMLVKAIIFKDPTCLALTPKQFLLTAHDAGLQHNMLALWNACRWFEEAFASDIAHGHRQATDTAGAALNGLQLPSMPGRYVLGRAMRLCEEREVLAEGSTFYPIFAQLGAMFEGTQGLGFTPGDLALMAAFLEACTQRAIALAGLMARKVVEMLTKQGKQLRRQTFSGAFPSVAAGSNTSAPEAQVPLEEFPAMVAELMGRVMSFNLDLAFNQHLAVLLVCCIFGAAAVLHIPLSFSGITATMVAELPDLSHEDFDKKVQLEPAVPADDARDPNLLVGCSIATPATLGYARQFYNGIFLKRMEGDLRELKAAFLWGLDSATAIHSSNHICAPPAPDNCAAIPGDVCEQQLPAARVAATTATSRQGRKPQPPAPVGKAPAASAYGAGGLAEARRPLASLRHSGSRKLDVLEDVDDKNEVDLLAPKNLPGVHVDSLFQAGFANSYTKPAARRLSAHLALRDLKLAVNGAAAAPLDKSAWEWGDVATKHHPRAEDPSLGLTLQSAAAANAEGRGSKKNTRDDSGEAAGWLPGLISSAERDIAAGAGKRRSGLAQIR